MVAYKREGYEMFEAMIQAIREETVRRIFLARIKTDEELKRGESGQRGRRCQHQRQNCEAAACAEGQKIGPNDPCPCGSGKKYKKCCRDKDIAEGRT